MFAAHAERSWFEGLQRGVFEGLAAGVGFVLLGRALGLAPAPAPEFAGAEPRPDRPHSDQWQPDRLVADADRSRAELILRESYADGRLSLQELIRRVGAVHDARTVADLRAALSGLPDS